MDWWWSSNDYGSNSWNGLEHEMKLLMSLKWGKKIKTRVLVSQTITNTKY